MTVPSLSYKDILEEAFERCGREMRGGYDLRTARRSMSLLTMEWQNKGLNLWKIEERTKAITSAAQEYTLETDEIDLIEHVIRDGSNDTTLTRVTVSDWARQSVKSQTSKPTQIYIDRQKTAPVVTLWPYPDASYTLVYWAMIKMDSLTSGIDGSPDVPTRFIPALTSGLAFYLSQKIKPDVGPQRRLELRTDYAEQMASAIDEDRDRASFYVQPDMSGYY